MKLKQMKLFYRSKYLHSGYWAVAMLLSSCVLFAQERAKLLKVGGFIYFHDKGYNGISAHAEYEFSIAKTYAFGSGPRFEYIDLKSGTPLLTIGYELKYYPLAKHFMRVLHGPFLGLDAIYLMESTAYPRSRFGPGIGLIVGYQHRLGNRIVICAEASPIYMKDLNEKSTSRNKANAYWYVFACVKIGWSF